MTEEWQEVWSRIAQIAEANVDTWPDMDFERFAHILNQEIKPSSLDIALIAEAFEVTVAWLITGNDHGMCEGIIGSLQADLQMYRTENWQLKEVLARLRAEHATCPGAHKRVNSYYSEEQGCDLVECSCGWTYDAEDECPGVEGIHE